MPLVLFLPSDTRRFSCFIIGVLFRSPVLRSRRDDLMFTGVFFIYFHNYNLTGAEMIINTIVVDVWCYFNKLVSFWGTIPSFYREQK